MHTRVFCVFFCIVRFRPSDPVLDPFSGSFSAERLDTLVLGTLDRLKNMGHKYYSQGDYAKALEWYHRALDGQEKTLGRDHPDTLATVSNMGSVSIDLGEYVNALGWYQKALTGQEKTLGRDHPDTLATVSNMGSVSIDLGKYVNALGWYQKALNGQEKALGSDHPDTLFTARRIGCVYFGKGDYEKALYWYQKALNGQKKALGSDHPDTLLTVRKIGSVLITMGEYEKALEWYRRALDGRKKTLGENPQADAFLTEFQSKYDIALQQKLYAAKMKSYNDINIIKTHPNPDQESNAKTESTRDDQYLLPQGSIDGTLTAPVSVIDIETVRVLDQSSLVTSTPNHYTRIHQDFLPRVISMLTFGLLIAITCMEIVDIIVLYF